MADPRRGPADDFDYGLNEEVLKSLARTPMAPQGMSPPGAIAPTGVKFSFWSSMADLVRLVLRSKAKGLKTRLGVALTLVLIGKWTGVIAPLFIKNGIDRLNHGHSLPQAILTGFIAYALGSTALRFIANTAPYMRDSI